MTMLWVFLVLVVLGIVLFLGRYFANRNIVQYSVPEVHERLKQGEALLLDVRTDGERAANSIPGSIHIPLHLLPQSVNSLKEHGEKEFICFCRTGNRSMGAADLLGKSGLKAASMKGGIMAWSLPKKETTSGT